MEERTLPSTFTVFNLLDIGPSSLHAAVAATNVNPDTDLIHFADDLQGTIPRSSELSITQELTSAGPGANKITLSGGDATRVFQISGATVDVALSGLTIANGRASGATLDGPLGPATLGGGILHHGACLSISHVTLVNNQVIGFNDRGGAIANVFAAALTVNHCTFTANRATGGNPVTSGVAGGAILNDAGSVLNVAHSTLTGNQAAGADGSTGTGGGIWNGSPNALTGTPSPLTILDSTIGNNHADSDAARLGGTGGQGVGGGIYVLRGGIVCVDLVTHFTHNHASTSEKDVYGILCFIEQDYLVFPRCALPPRLCVGTIGNCDRT